MRKAVRFFVVCALVLLPAVSFAGERFDGKWLTTYTCPAKGSTDGFTWKFPSMIRAGNLRGERGTAGEPGYFLVEGPIKDDGSAKLSATGIVASRKYARGAFAHGGADYSFEAKAQFTDTKGTGTRNEGLGVYGRPCTFEFVKQ
ncbi:MAG: hypothetical protein ABSC77_05400 [Terracidiphilus sp.]|jgi:hypothetical protein